MFLILRLLLFIVPLNWVFQIWTALKIRSIRVLRESNGEIDNKPIVLKGTTRYVVSATISLVTMLFAFYVAFAACVRCFVDLDGYMFILALIVSVGLIPLIPALSLKFAINRLVEVGIINE